LQGSAYFIEAQKLPWLSH